MSGCLRPFFTKTGNLVPCGHCSECLRRHANAWSFRLQHHSNNSKLTLFVTLTYGDNNLPCNSALFSCNNICFTRLRKDKIFVGDPRTLEVSIVDSERYNNALHSFNKLTKYPISVDDVSKFFPLVHDVPSVRRRDIVLYHKRLRQSLVECGITLKYFTCAEYGGQTHRPHYHELLFLNGKNLDLPRFDINFFKTCIASSWNNGSVDVSVPDSYGAVNYTNKYMRKRCYVPIGADPVFRLMSKGIGLPNTSSLKTDIENLGPDARVYFPSGVPCNMPRYYRDRFGKPHDFLDDVEISKKRVINDLAEYRAWLSYHNKEDTYENRVHFFFKELKEIKQEISDSITSSSHSKSIINEKL